MSGLPEGWIDAVMEDVADIQLGKMLDKMKNKGDPTPYLRNINVRWGSFDLSDVLEMRFTPEERVFFSIEDNDLIVCEGGEPGRAAIWRAGPTVLKYQKALHRVRLPEWVIPDFVYYFLRHASKQGLLESFLTGTTIKHLPRNAFLRFKLPLPPKNEQRRIVDKLDSLFESTRRASEELSHIPRLIENYKKAILEAAFRGDLTKDWRSQRAPSPVDAESADIDSRSGGLPTLPSQWSWASVGAVSAISGGLTKNARRRGLPTRVPYLRVANVYIDELRLNDVQEIGCTPKELQKTALKFGDLLIVEGNGSIDQIGRVALWDGSIPVCSHQNHLIRARTGPKIVPEFLLFWMLSPLGRRYIERVASSSSGLHTLSISKVSGLPVPLCSIAEMNEITARIRARLRDIASLQRETSQSALLLDRLDQANVSKAFRGELVPQDPNDEPASVLLERICVARAQQPKNTRKGRGKTANARVAA